MAKKRKTLGKMSNFRMMWEINPASRVKLGKYKYPSRSETKRSLRNGNWDD